MYKIQDLFDPSKQLNRKIESVVTFGATEETDLREEIKEYIVTEKLHSNYEKVLEELQGAFDNGSKEVGIWVSGFYGSGKSSFAKYLGLSFDKSIMIDGVTFGDKLLSRISDTTISAIHHGIINRYKPLVVMIDLSTQARAGKTTPVSDIVYYETLKQLGITKCSDEKVMAFINLLQSEGKYDRFLEMVQKEAGKSWSALECNNLTANIYAAKMAPKIFPQYFPDEKSFKSIELNNAINEEERFTNLYNVIKQNTGCDKVVFVLDEVGQYVASNVDFILNLQGMLQIFKDKFKGSVWVIATAQQTLAEDNQQAQLNSNELYRLEARFPHKVDIEANDIKEIITKRLLGKSPEGAEYMKNLFANEEGQLKLAVHLNTQAKSIYNQILDADSFANLYPFLPVHISILMSLLQKLASRTGGVGLRSVLRLIRDILIDNKLADATIGTLACPEQFYDALKTDMEKNTTKEIVLSANTAIQMFNGNALAVRICKTVATMQILDDFNLSFENLCALLYNEIGKPVDKDMVRNTLQEIMDADGVTLQVVEGKYQFMTNAILGIRDERNRYVPREQEKVDVLQELVKDIMYPAPSVNIYGTKTINASVELSERNRLYSVLSASNIKINIRFVTSEHYDTTKNTVLVESSNTSNVCTLYWICTLPRDKEALLQDICKSSHIRSAHSSETNKEIKAYLSAQEDNIEKKKLQLRQLLSEAQNNSEIIFRGTPQVVNVSDYITKSLKPSAEKIYEKYPYAATALKSDCVKKFVSYSNIQTLPDNLNPLGIIDKQNGGTIDITHRAIVEIKDFISTHNDVTGSEIFTHFEKHPYGWTKDTIRYVVTLMLKASVVQLRISGKDYKVLGETAINALDGNNSFQKISVMLNTDKEILPRQLVKAASRIVELFNSSRPAPNKDDIAKEALSKIKPFNKLISEIKQNFDELKLGGTDIISKAQTFAERIIQSEGGDAAFLLGVEDDCYTAFKFINDVKKCDEVSSLFIHLKHIKKIIEDAASLPELPSLEEFSNEITGVKQMYDQYRSFKDIQSYISEITDLRNQTDAAINKACIEYKSTTNEDLKKQAENIIAMPQYQQLTDDQKNQINAELGLLSVDFTTASVTQLRDMVNKTNSFSSLLNGTIVRIRKKVERLAEENIPIIVSEPPVSAINTPVVNTTHNVTTYPKPGAGTGTTTVIGATSTGSTTQTPAVQNTTPKVISVRRRISTRQQLQDVIAQLQKMLENFSDDTPIELNFND